MKAELKSVHLVVTNDKTKTVEDFVQSVVVGSNKTGIVVHFETTEKYVEIYVLHFGSEKLITIVPSDPVHGGWMDIDDPDYYKINIQIETDDISCAEVVTPLKHEYFVNLIPIDNLCDYSVIGK